MASENDVKIKISLDGADTAEKGLRGVGDGASDSDGKLGKLASGGLKGVAVAGAVMAAAVVGAGAGLWNLAKGAAEAGDRIDEQSHKLGISAEAYQSWDYVLSQTGASIESLKGGMTRLNNAVDDAKNGTGTAEANFARLGISVDDLAGKTREDIFALTIEGLQGVTDGGERAAIAADLLGRGAAELGGILSTSAEDTAALKQQAIDLGLILSDEAVAAGDAFNDSLDTLQRTMQGVKNTIGAQLLPGLTEVTLGLSGLLAGTEGSEERITAGAETLVTSISGVAPKILGVFSNLLGVVAVIAPQLITSLVGGITANLPTLIGTVSGALVSLVTLLAAQAPGLIGAGAQAVVSLVTGVTKALPTLIPAVIGGILGVVQAVIGALPLLLNAGLQLVLGLATGIIDSIPVIIAMLPALIEGIVGFIETGVPMLLEAGISLFMAIVEALPQIIDQLVAVLPTLITSVIGALLGAIPLIIQAGITLLTSLVGALPTIITSIVSALPLIITSIITAVLGAIPMLINAGIDLFIALIGALPTIIVAIVGAIPQIITGVIGALVNAIPLLIDTGIKLFVAIIENMPAILGGIVGAIPQIITGIVGAIVGAVPQLADAGLKLIQGLWQGISDASAWLMGKISGFVDDVMEGIKDFFDINSPSRRMEIQVGAHLPSGIGVGVKKNADDAIRPIQDLNTKIMDEALRLNTTVAFTHEATLTQTAVPMRPMAQQQGPVSVQATLDPEALTAAIAEAFGDGGEAQPPVRLDRESIVELGTYIADSVQLTSRQGSSPLG